MPQRSIGLRIEDSVLSQALEWARGVNLSQNPKMPTRGDSDTDVMGDSISLGNPGHILDSLSFISLARRYAQSPTI